MRRGRCETIYARCYVLLKALLTNSFIAHTRVIKCQVKQASVIQSLETKTERKERKSNCQYKLLYNLQRPQQNICLEENVKSSIDKLQLPAGYSQHPFQPLNLKMLMLRNLRTKVIMMMQQITQHNKSHNTTKQTNRKKEKHFKSKSHNKIIHTKISSQHTLTEIQVFVKIRSSGSTEKRR